MMDPMGILIDKNWRELLGEELQKPYVEALKNFLQEEKHRQAVVFPPEEEIFKALSYCPYEAVKVVIVGQDPYHGQGQAHGLSFSVKPGVAIPPSLKNIYKELQSDLGLKMPSTGCLIPWAKQGVLLLNATLTVRKGEPKSHFGKGWETLTDSIVKVLAARKQPLVFMLWGKSAQDKVAGALLGNTNHLILKAAHPSPYSAQGFLGCRHFSIANTALEKWGQTPIDWQIS